MDADLQALRRAHEANPSDVTTARRYDDALRRAGRGPEAEARLIDKYVCSRTWDQLTRSAESSRRRWCDLCEGEVQFTDLSEIAGRIDARTGLAIQAAFDTMGEAVWLLRRATHLHTAAEQRVGRVHLWLQSCPLPPDIEHALAGAEPLLAKHGVWPVAIDHSRTDFGSTPAQDFDRFLPVFQVVMAKFTPPDREPVMIVGANPAFFSHRLPPTPPRLVLGFTNRGNFVTRYQEALPSFGDRIREVLEERAHAIARGEGDLPSNTPRFVRIRGVASPPFLESLGLLDHWLDRAGVSETLQFQASATPLDLSGTGPLDRAAVFAALDSHAAPGESGCRVAFIERGDAQGWFAHHRGRAAVVHLDRFARRGLRSPNVLIASHLLVKKLLDMAVRDPLPLHAEARGCLFDGCRDKAELDDRIRAGSICADCRARLEGQVSEPILTAVGKVLAAGRREVEAR